jgi:hypothetical protein
MRLCQGAPSPCTTRAMRSPQLCIAFDPEGLRNRIYESATTHWCRLFQLQGQSDRVAYAVPKWSRLACHSLPCCAIFSSRSFFFAHGVQQATQVRYIDHRVLILLEFSSPLYNSCFQSAPCLAKSAQKPPSELPRL